MSSFELGHRGHAVDVEKDGAVLTEIVTASTSGESLPDHSHLPQAKHDAIRIDGDDEDHDHEPPMTFKRFMPLLAMAFLWTGSQIPVYLFGSIPPFIYGDIGGVDRWIWFVLAYLLALAAVCPFVGSLSDLFGRRNVALMGASLLIIGNIVSCTAHNMNVFIGGMAITGIGAGINELTALAVTSELAPTRKRGLYNAIMIFTIVPYCPSQMWGQLVAYYGNWRWIGLWVSVWCFIGFALTAIFFHPPPRVNSQGLSRREVVNRIDFVGGFLSISGLLLFMMGLQWGGYNYPWTSPHTLVPLLLGVALTAAFLVWEAKFAKHPMFPHRLKQEPRVLALTLVITAISGASFFGILLFWPTQSYNVYGQDPWAVGVRSLPLGFSILTGATVVLGLLTYLRGHIRTLILVSCIFMTVGGGAMSILTRQNLYAVYPIIIVAGLGIGGIVVPASIITTIICPDDLIATVTALTLAIRVLGGAIGYCVYYNIFIIKFVARAKTVFAPQIGEILQTTNVTIITDVIGITGSGLLALLKEIPGVNKPGVYDALVLAGQECYAYGYKWVYYVTIAFGCLSIICACFLGDIGKYMDDHVAVVMR